MSQTRINFIANLINNKDLVADVGSDHALLSKILIDNKKAKKVINLEKNNQPLLNSIEATKDYQDSIINIKSDGLDDIQSSLLINVCTIMGMGGITISKILDKAKDKKVETYILQPNNMENIIRQWSFDNDWKIMNEYLVEDSGIIYEIIVLNKINGYIPKNNTEIIFGKMNIKNRESLFLKKWNKIKLEIKYKKLDKLNTEKAQILVEIEKVIN